MEDTFSQCKFEYKWGVQVIEEFAVKEPNRARKVHRKQEMFLITALKPFGAPKINLLCRNCCIFDFVIRKLVQTA